MALGDYNYDEYLNDPDRYKDYLSSDRYSDILPSSTFDPAKAGDYSNTKNLSLEILSGAKKFSEENDLDEMTEEEVEDWWLKEQGGQSETGAFKEIERTLERA